MKNNLKLIIIIICIIIIIITAILLSLLFLNKEKISNGEEIYYSDQDTHFRNELEKVTSKYDYFDTISCIQKYTNTLKKLDTSTYAEKNNEIIETINIYKEDLYYLLDENYINQYNLTLNNIDSKLSNYYTSLNFQIEIMYVVDSQEEVAIYFAYGNLINEKKNTNEKYGFVVKRNTENLSFTILPYDYMIDKGYEEESILNKDLSNLKNTSIKQNYNNYYKSNAYDDEYISKYYFEQYKENLQFNVAINYNKMDKEYREKKFGTLKNYQEYVNENLQELLKCNLNQYNIEIEDEYNNYICKDQFDNYYIFRESDIGDYTILLDTYTILEQKFEEKYKVSTNQEKIGMNITNFFQMLNIKDYSTAYKCLSTNFKDSNFKTVDSFKRYVKEKLYSYNNIKFVKFSDEISGIYTYYIEISNKEDDKDSKIKMNVIMRLLDNTEYELSFQIID